LPLALVAAAPALAHHGFGLFQMQEFKDYSGTLTKLELVNPHSYLYFETVDADGKPLAYDALLLALGAATEEAVPGALTFGGEHDVAGLRAALARLHAGAPLRVAFVAAAETAWTLPLYELALMTAQRAYDAQTDVSITIATPEHEPLAIFGRTVSEAVGGLLDENRITVVPSAHCDVPAPGQISIHPGDRTLGADRIVALPHLSGPPTPGVPGGAASGFIPIDEHCRVRGLEAVFAAGDATDFPIKHGGIAAQQADTAAEAIAALAGTPLVPTPFHPEIRAILLGGERPLYLSAHVTGGHGTSSQISEEPMWSPPTKIAARYLAPYLESRDREAGRAVS
jgi:sulfide:quinone oxidoreductase